MGPLNATLATSLDSTVPIGLTRGQQFTVRTDHKSSIIPAKVGNKSLSGRSNNFVKPAPGHEALELLFSHVVMQSEAARYASNLMSTFGSLGAVLACRTERMLDACENDHQCVSLLGSAHKFMEVVLHEPLKERPILNDLKKVYDYLMAMMAHNTNEEVRILLLNNKNALLIDEVHSRGTVNHVPIYPREVAKRVFEVGACAVILVHNHPSGDPTPSKDDIEMTLRLQELLDRCDVRFHDHIIVGRVRCVSMRNLGLI